MGHFGDDVGRGRGHENGIGLFGKRDMVNRVGGVVEQVDRNLLVRERSKGGGAHERSRVLGHADLDTHAGLLEKADNLTCLIRGDASRNANENGLWHDYSCSLTTMMRWQYGHSA